MKAVRGRYHCLSSRRRGKWRGHVKEEASLFLTELRLPAVRMSRSSASAPIPGAGTEMGSPAVAMTAALIAAWVAGCAPSSATLRPAHVAPPGHVQVAVGAAVSIPTGTVANVLDIGEAIAATAQSQPISDAQKWQLFDAAVNLASSPPSVSQHLLLAVTAVDRTEINLQYAGGGWRFGGRYQLATRAAGPFDLVAGLGVSRSVRSLPFADFLPVIRANQTARWTVDVPLTLGTSRQWFRAWAGPKLMYTHLETNLQLDLVNEDPVSAGFTGSGLYWGAQGGFAVGYRHVFLGFELTFLQLSGRAEVVTTLAAEPRRRVAIGGLVVTPALAFMGEF